VTRGCGRAMVSLVRGKLSSSAIAWRSGLCMAGLPNSGSSKGQTDQHKFAAGCKIYFITVVVQKEILQRQLYIGNRAVATFSAIATALAGRMLCRPDVWGVGPSVLVTPFLGLCSLLVSGQCRDSVHCPGPLRSPPLLLMGFNPELDLIPKRLFH